jgi:hypothetical protein
MFQIGKTDLPKLVGAACKDTLIPDIFFPDSFAQEQDVKPWIRKICEPCPARLECLQYAIDHDIVHGFWGGVSPTERDRIRPMSKTRRRNTIAEVEKLLDLGLSLENACKEVGVLVDSYRTNKQRIVSRHKRDKEQN